MEDSMLDMPNLAFDEKIGNKRVRDGENEIKIGRLEKRPSGIFGVNGDEDYKDEGDKRKENGGDGVGIIDSFISNVFHKKESGIEEEVKNDVKVEDKSEKLSVDGGSEGGEGGGIINTFFSNIFQNNGSEKGDCDKVKGDLANEVVEKTEALDGGREGELDNLNAKKSTEKDDTLHDLPSKNLEGMLVTHAFLIIS